MPSPRRSRRSRRSRAPSRATWRRCPTRAGARRRAPPRRRGTQRVAGGVPTFRSASFVAYVRLRLPAYRSRRGSARWRASEALVSAAKNPRRASSRETSHCAPATSASKIFGLRDFGLSAPGAPASATRAVSTASSSASCACAAASNRRAAPSTSLWARPRSEVRAATASASRRSFAAARASATSDASTRARRARRTRRRASRRARPCARPRATPPRPRRVSARRWRSESRARSWPPRAPPRPPRARTLRTPRATRASLPRRELPLASAFANAESACSDAARVSVRLRARERRERALHLGLRAVERLGRRLERGSRGVDDRGRPVRVPQRGAGATARSPRRPPRAPRGPPAGQRRRGMFAGVNMDSSACARARGDETARRRAKRRVHGDDEATIAPGRGDAESSSRRRTTRPGRGRATFEKAARGACVAPRSERATVGRMAMVGVRGFGARRGARGRCAATVRGRERLATWRARTPLWVDDSKSRARIARARKRSHFLHTRGCFVRPRSPAAPRRFPPLAGRVRSRNPKEARSLRALDRLGARRDVVTSPVARRPPPRARPADIGSLAPLAMSAPIPDFNPRSRARQHSRVDAVRLESRSPETAKKASRARRSIARAALRATRPGRARALVFSTHSPPRPRPARAARARLLRPPWSARSRPSPRWDPPPPPPARARPSLSTFRTTSCTRRTTTRA